MRTLQEGGPAAFRIRLILAATLGATYGIYSGFELCENRAVPGTEEYLESEKYQYRHWDPDRPGHITDLVTAINRIRRENPALQSNDGLMFCDTDNPNLIAFCKVSPDRSNAILVVVNVDHEHMQHGSVRVPLSHIGLPQSDGYDVVDQLDGARYTWRGEWNYVRLDPNVGVAHVFDLPIAAADVVTGTGKALARFLPRQRWFAGKARAIANVRILDWSPRGSRDHLRPVQRVAVEEPGEVAHGREPARAIGREVRRRAAPATPRTAPRRRRPATATRAAPAATVFLLRLDPGRGGDRCTGQPVRERELDVGADPDAIRQALGEPALHPARAHRDHLGRERIPGGSASSARSAAMSPSARSERWT